MGCTMPVGCRRQEVTMARTVAALPAGSRITDYISLGVIAKFFPVEKIREVLDETKRASIRERDLPAHVVVYYVIALALYMRSSYREVLRCLLEGVQWLLDPSAKVKVAGQRNVVLGRSFFPKLQTLAHGRQDGSGLALAHTPKCPPGCGETITGWLLPQPDLRVHFRPPESA